MKTNKYFTLFITNPITICTVISIFLFAFSFSISPDYWYDFYIVSLVLSIVLFVSYWIAFVVAKKINKKQNVTLKIKKYKLFLTISILLLILTILYIVGSHVTETVFSMENGRYFSYFDFLETSIRGKTSIFHWATAPAFIIVLCLGFFNALISLMFFSEIKLVSNKNVNKSINNQFLSKDNIGNKICEIREKRNLTQMELASKLLISIKVVSDWEQSKSYPSMDLLNNMSKILDYDFIKYLFEGDKDV